MTKLHLLLGLLTLLVFALAACGRAGDAVTPPPDNPDIRISVGRLHPTDPAINAIAVTVVRTKGGTLELPGRTIEIAASAGDVGPVTDRGDGSYEAIWTGESVGEVLLVARDVDSDPPVETAITFLALEYLSSEWDVPVKLAAPISTNGWDTAPCLYPDGNRLAFAYITLDMLALAAEVTRPIGEERPGQSTPQTLDIYIAERHQESPTWWSGWTVEHAQCNLFQALAMHIAAPSIASDGMSAFCTVQEFEGEGYGPSTIYLVDPDFSRTPVALGEPVDMTGVGEDNPYYDATHGWLYFDTYDLGDPLSKQNIWAARSIGGGEFEHPVPLSSDINTPDVETQAFVHEPTEMLYFASDRGMEEFQLAIWRTTIYGEQAGTPEPVARGALALGRPSISLDGEWFCFAYARVEPGGANADIAMCRRIE